jgi:YesN/AraC family two-component response regulator
MMVMKIVIADDSSLLRERIISLLNGSSKNLVIYEAENGKDALNIIRQKKPDLAILDIRMPEMSGIEVLKKIRELKIKTRICILTNYPYPQYRKRCIEEGADYFLDKNIDFMQICDIISKFLDNNRNG